MCKAPKIPTPPPPPPAPIQSAEISQASDEALNNQKKKLRNNFGRKATILTGALGLNDKAETTNSAKTLLGQ